MSQLSQASNSINQDTRRTAVTHWFGASYFFALLVLSIALQIAIKSDLASSLTPSTVKTISGYTYSAILLFGFFSLIGLLWSATDRVIAFVQEAIDRAKKSKRDLFFSELSALISTAIRSILRAPRKFLYWLAGANSQLLYSKWHSQVPTKLTSSDDQKENPSEYLSVFSQTAIKAENVGLTLLAIGIYIFAVIAYLLSMVFQPQPTGSPQLKMTRAAIVSPATQTDAMVTNKNIDSNQANISDKTTESVVINAVATINVATIQSGVTSGTATDSLGLKNGNPSPEIKADGSVSEKLKKIPFVGEILNKVVGHLELVVVCIAAFFATAVILVDRSIYVDKTVERWLWDRRLSRSKSNQDKSDEYFTGFRDWGTFFIKVVLKYSPRVLLAVALSYFGAVAGELFFFQRDIDARLSKKLEEKIRDVRSRPEGVPTFKHVLLAAKKSERDALSELNKLTDNINLLRAVLDHERRPGIKAGAKTNPKVFGICLTSKYDPEGDLPMPRGVVKESDSGPEEGCPSDMYEHPVITNLNSTGAAGEGTQSKTRAAELNEFENKVERVEAALRKTKDELQAALSSYEGRVRSEAILELGANGFLKRIAVLEQLKQDEAYMDKPPVQSLPSASAIANTKVISPDPTSSGDSGDNPIRLLSKSLLIALLAFELLPLAFKLADLLFFFRIDEADLVAFSLGTKFAAVCSDSSAEPPSFVDEKESSEKFFDTALQFVQKRIPELLLPVAAGLIMLVFFVDAVSGIGNSDIIKWMTSVIEPKR